MIVGCGEESVDSAFAKAVEVNTDTLPGDATSFPLGRLVNITFNEELTVAFLQVEGLVAGQLYHVTGSVNVANFFKFFDSDFTADSSEMVIERPVDVDFRERLLLKVEVGPSQ